MPVSALHFKTRYVKFRSFFSEEQSQLISNSDDSSIVDALKIDIRRNRKKMPSILRMKRKSPEIHLRFLKNNKFLNTWVNYLRTRLHHSAGEKYSFSWETKPHGDGKSGRPITSSSNPKGRTLTKRLAHRTRKFAPWECDHRSEPQKSDWRCTSGATQFGPPRMMMVIGTCLQTCLEIGREKSPRAKKEILTHFVISSSARESFASSEALCCDRML